MLTYKNLSKKSWQKSKSWSEWKFWLEIGILVKHGNFSQKINILVINGILGQEFEFHSKLQIVAKRIQILVRNENFS